jgi:hypothetical protein
MTTTSELRAKLDRQGEEISRLTHRIEDKLETYKDWPGLVRQYPLQSLGIAAAAGLMLSGASTPILRGVGKQLGTLLQASITASIVSGVSGLTKSQNA